MAEWVDFGAVKRAVSLEAVLLHYQVPGLRRRRDQLEGRCPIHGGERDDSFRASLRKNVFHCFACQASGNVLDFVAAMEQCPVREAALRLQRWFGLGEPSTRWALPRQVPEAGQRGELVRKKEGGNAPLRFALTGVDHDHPYLRQRGVDDATAAAFGVGFYGGAGLMHGRIVIPIHNAAGALVAYAGRAVDGRAPKYKLPAGFRKGLELYNLPRALATGSKTAIVVEGYFDCLRVHQAGFPWVVALRGSCLSVEQEQVLVKRFERVVLVLDGDAAGRSGTRLIGTRLAGRCAVDAINLPDGVQADQLSTAEIQDLLHMADKDCLKQDDAVA